MQLELAPKDLYQKLEFDKIIKLLAEECLGELGREIVANIRPETTIQQIRKKLRQTEEFKRTLENNDPFPLQTYEEISEDVRMLEIENYVMSEESLQRVNLILLSIRNIFRFFSPPRRELYPTLYAIIDKVIFEEQLIKEIERVIDEEGEIKPDASPELLRIRQLMQSKVRELDKRFGSIILKYRKKGWLTDNVESFRNGRRVLSVPSEHKRKIRGIIHDESTTGKTAFIEPEEIIEINNDIFDLETEERREIYRILKELSAFLRPYASLIRSYQYLLADYDFIRAKARLGSRLRANMPKLDPKPRLGIKRGFHPLLFLKNSQIGKEVVPFELDLHKPNRLLMLSGPNAGGKSITMKSVGLLQLMVQSGMLVPVDPESEMGIFKAIFADIGDQQSIEDDLSTYSSRLENMRYFLEHANRDSLVLIDEFGSGTDPKIGGAIAEAILKELNQQKVSGVITTHYSNLKIFAFKSKGIVNGSMLFDKDTLSPTYELRVGRPGSSYAYEIAQKSGLSEAVLKYARHKTGKNEKAIDELLVELQNDKLQLEEELDKIKEQEARLQKLIRTYEQMHKELEFRRKRIKLEAKEQALQQAAQSNRELENLVRELKEAEKLERQEQLEKARELAAQVKTEREELVGQVKELREEVYYKPLEKKKEDKPIEVGDHVKLVTGGATGVVDSISKNRAIVLIGDLRMTIKLRDLQHAKAPLDVQSSKGVQTDTAGNAAAFKSKIDIRGMRMDEAMHVIQDFIDQALIFNAMRLEIIHGKGNGTLRNVVRSKLREYKVPMEISHPQPEQGGDGVTIVEMV